MSLSWIDFFTPQKGEVPCLGIALGRQALWVARTRGLPGSQSLEVAEKIPAGDDLFNGNSTEPFQPLAEVLDKFLPSKGGYLSVQVALPDPAMEFEVFELESLPAPGAPLRNFLQWRLKRDPADPELSFTHQDLGAENGKRLLLGSGVGKNILSRIEATFRPKGARASVVDGAYAYRFNFFHDAFARKGGSGALLTLDEEYWSLVIYDALTRLRFVRSKWWGKGIVGPSEIPLKEMAEETERTIRSWVYGSKNRSVENLFVTAPAGWLEAVQQAFRERVRENCEILSAACGNPLGIALEHVSPTALSVGVAR